MKLVGPEGLWSEPDHDLDVPMREHFERVSTGLANLRDFDDESGLMFLEVAARSR